MADRPAVRRPRPSRSLSPELQRLIDEITKDFASNYLTSKAANQAADGDSRTKPVALPPPARAA